MDQVAEVDEAADDAVSRQHVVIVDIPVNDAGSQLLPRHALPQAAKVANDAALFRVQKIQMRQSEADVAQVPVQLAVHQRMVKVLQGGIELRKAAPEGGQKLGTALPDRREKLAIEPADESQPVSPARPITDARDLLPRLGGQHLRDGQYGESLVSVPECRVLEVQHGRILVRLCDLENELCAAGTFEREVLISLTRQRARRHAQAEVLEHELPGLRGIESRSGVGRVHAGRFASHRTESAGMMKSVVSVEETSPPRITMAMGPSISCPGLPGCSATGRSARAVSSAVSSTGVNRSSAPRKAVSRPQEWPSCIVRKS